ncbi:large ribosomal subunit protein eL20z-like [Phragmites australis]|uniref:large ribosomal subunit protein eL20z-like n=1 Tax=Phragmites australis TaxID=29695 RepID=UPI002D781529|nr:large ribosomal subunit protein eL20z-like [Phragmites australis]
MSGHEGDKAKGAAGADYGTFQGPPSYPPPRPPPVGFPQPVPPPGLSGHPPAEPYSRHRGGYQAVQAQDYEAGVRGHSHHRLPCCGIGIGWFLFIIGFFLGAIPWYVGAFLLWCSRVDYREKPGYVACTIAAVVATIAVIIGATAGAHVY